MIQSNVGHNVGSTLWLPNRHCDDMGTIEDGHSSSLETIRAMMDQEESHYYKVENYFRRETSKVPGRCSEGEDTMDVDTIAEIFVDEPIDPECRFRMSEWCYQIADFCGYKRATVAIAMSCLDRFIASNNDNGVGHRLYRDRSQFQLASMVCFYSSVKIHEHEAMDAELVARLSRGVFEAKQIEDMEATMLSSLGFRMNPPTALAFSKFLLDLIPAHMIDHEFRDAGLELAKFQTEIAVSDVDLMDIKPSLIALAALINSFDSLNMDTKMQRYIIEILSTAVQVDCDSSIFRDVRIRLYEGLAGDGMTNNPYCSSITPQPATTGGLSRVLPTTLYEPSGSIRGQ